MSVDFRLDAELRHDKGRGASRRLRRAGKVPAIMYGGGSEPVSLTFDKDAVSQLMQYEAFFSSVLDIQVDGAVEQAVVRDLQRHPAKPTVLTHMDLLRVKKDQPLRVHVPLHFTNEEVAPGAKQQGGVISHHLVEAEVECLPRDIPEYIEVDLGSLQAGEAFHLSDVHLPEGVQFVELQQGPEHDLAVVSIHLPRSVTAGGGAAGEGEEGGE